MTQILKTFSETLIEDDNNNTNNTNNNNKQNLNSALYNLPPQMIELSLFESLSRQQLPIPIGEC
jgi:hypothetical protein